MATAASADDDDYSLCKKDVERIGVMLRWFESQPRFAAAEAIGNGPAARFRLAQSTDEITARIGDEPGSGPITLYTFDSDGLVMTTMSEDFTAYNFTGGTIASGTWLLVAKVDGQWFVAAADCS